MLPPEETDSFFAAMKKAGAFNEYCGIRNRILMGHFPIVRSLVRCMVGKPRLWEDMESEGVWELIRAIDRYDPKIGAPFRAYAVVCVRNRILDELMSSDGFGIAGNAARNLHSLRRSVAEGPALNDSLSNAPPIPPRAVRRLSPFVYVVSFDSPAGETFDGFVSDTPLGEFARLDPTFADEPVYAAESVQMDEDLAVLGKALQRLPWKARFIVERLYGLDGHPPHTQSEVACLFGVSRQRVSQIRAATLMRLKESGWGLD